MDRVQPHKAKSSSVAAVASRPPGLSLCQLVQDKLVSLEVLNPVEAELFTPSSKTRAHAHIRGDRNGYPVTLPIEQDF